MTIEYRTQQLKQFTPLAWRPSIKDVVLQAGWTRYVPDREPEAVDFPIEPVCVLDTETFVNAPSVEDAVMATAMSNVAFYIWLHPSIVESEAEWAPMLIPVAPESVFIAHNSSFDSSRVDPLADAMWFCTQSAHVAVSGMCSEQERWFQSANPQYVPPFAEVTCPGNLIDVYNLYCFKDLKKSLKETRNIFVEAKSHREFHDDLLNLIDYAINDVVITAELFNVLFPLYLGTAPHDATLESHLIQSACLTPVADEWFDWLANVEHHYELAKNEIDQALTDLAWQVYTDWQDLPEIIEGNSWGQLNWDANWKTNKAGKPSNVNTYGVPKWLLECRITKSQPVTRDNILVTIGSNIAPLLLQVNYKGHPLVYDKNWKWCYEHPEEGLTRLPHPEGKANANVGSVFSQDWLEAWEDGTFTSSCEQAIDIVKRKIQIGFWTSARSRAHEMRVVNL